MSRDALLAYYERELEFIRSMAVDFAKKYPAIASSLQLPSVVGPTADPHVERLIEAFAMLAARVQLRVDDEFSEITDALLGILYPHYVAPVPSLAILQLEPDPDGACPPQGLRIARGATLYSKPVQSYGGVRCRFRTSYPVTLWPIQIESAELASATALGTPVPSGVRSILRLRLRTVGNVTFGQLVVDRLRLYLGAQANVGHRLYELMCRDPRGLAVQRNPGAAARMLPESCVTPVGFACEEGILEYPPESFLGYRLLQEYFSFPQKYLFVDLCDLDLARVGPEDASVDVSVLLPDDRSELDLRVRARDFRLGCTPAVNLFEMRADPIRVTQTAIEYPVFPDVRHQRAYEVYSVRSASTVERGTGKVTDYEPIYTARHGAHSDHSAYWYAARRASVRREDDGTDVFISLVDEKLNPMAPPSDVLHVTALCTNRDLASMLRLGDPAGDFDIQGYPGVTRVVALGKPTPPRRAPLGAGSSWRLISHLALNHLSLCDSSEGPEVGQGEVPPALHALREILRLYDFEDSPSTRQRIGGITSLHTRRVVRRVSASGDAGFARGTLVELVFDPERFAGTGVFLFASILEAFLGLYTSLNSFTQTVACVRTREGVLKRWPPRAGEQRLL